MTDSKEPGRTIWEIVDEGDSWCWRYYTPLVSGFPWEAWMRDPDAWIQQSHNLDNAAGLLEPHIANYNPVDAQGLYRANFVVTQHMMLCGMALECAVKARYLHRGGGVTVTDKGPLKFDSLPGSAKHELTTMAGSEFVALDLDARASELLRLLSWAIQFGRYPAFLRASTSSEALGKAVTWSRSLVDTYKKLRNNLVSRKDKEPETLL
jgi:hypothetical protein